MSKSKVTIKEIAEMAGVSIATVSHVINRTRYVRPELVDKIEKIIVETGYQNKIADKERKTAGWTGVHDSCSHSKH